MGLHVCEIHDRLRPHAGLKKQAKSSSQQNLRTALQKAIAKIAEERKAHNDHIKAIMTERGTQID